MANEVQFARQDTGKTLYFAVRNSVGSVWDGASFVAITSITWTNADIPLVHQALGDYYGTFPAGMSVGQYTLEIFEQVGASPDRLADTLLASAHVIWKGVGRLLYATEVLGEMIEDDAGVMRYTTNALEQAPTGGGASAATIADAVWDELLSGHVVVGSAGERLGRVPNAAAGGNGGLPTVNASNYIAGIAGTKNQLDDLNDPTVSQIADQVWDESISGHAGVGSAGERLGRIPNAAAGGSGGLATVNASNFVAGVAADVNANVTKFNGTAVELSGTVPRVDVKSIDTSTVAAANLGEDFDGDVVIYNQKVGLLQLTTIASVTSQQQFALVAGSTDNDAYNNCRILIRDAVTPEQVSIRRCADYIGATRTVILDAAPVFTIQAGDMVYVIAGDQSGSAADVASIADAVWDEALAAHNTAGSAGERLARIPNAAAGGNGGLATVDASNFIAGIAGTKNQLDDLNDLSSATVDARLAAIGLDHLVSTSVSGTDVADNSIVARLVSKNATADWDSFNHTTDSLEGIRDNQVGADASAVADAVLDELLAGHTTAGSVGERLSRIPNANAGGSGGLPTVDASNYIAGIQGTLNQLDDLSNVGTGDIDACLAAIGLDHLVAVAVSGADVADNSIVARLASKAGTADWDTFNHTTDSLEALHDTQMTGTPVDIAAAVWDALAASYANAGTFGERLGRIPNAAAGGNGGLPTVDASNFIAGIQGVKNQLDDLNDLSSATVDARLAAIGLDHLVAAAVTGTDITDNSIIARLASKTATADWDTFNHTTDSLEALHDTQMTGTPIDIAAAVWDAVRTDFNDAGSFGETLNSLQPKIANLDAAITSRLAGNAVPANFSALAITLTGQVDAMLKGFVGTTLTESSAGRIAGNFKTFFDNANAASTKKQDDVGTGGGGGGSLDVAATAKRLADRFVWRLGKFSEGITARNKIAVQSGHSSTLAMDFEKWLSPGETLETIVGVTDAGGGSDLTIVTGSIVFEEVRARITGGINGVDYRVRYRATTNLGNTLDAEGILQVRDS